MCWVGSDAKESLEVVRKERKKREKDVEEEIYPTCGGEPADQPSKAL